MPDTNSRDLFPGAVEMMVLRLLKDGLVDAEWGMSATNRRVRIWGES